MQTKLINQLLFNSCRHALSKQSSVRNNNGSPAAFLTRLFAFQLSHDELKKKQRCFGCLFIIRKIIENAPFFFSSKRRIGNYNINSVLVANVTQRNTQAVSAVNIRIFQTMQKQIHLAKQVG